MKKSLVLLVAISALLFLACEENLPPTTDNEVGEADTDVPEEDIGEDTDTDVPNEDVDEDTGGTDTGSDECPPPANEWAVRKVMVDGVCVCPPMPAPYEEGSYCEYLGCWLHMNDEICRVDCYQDPPPFDPPNKLLSGGLYTEYLHEVCSYIN